MKKNIIFITNIIISLFVIVILSIVVMNYNNGTKFKFNDSISKEDLINLYYEDTKLTLCENCLYSVSNWGDDDYSSLLKLEDNEYELVESFENVYTTNLDISIGDPYKKVIAYYGVLDNYAYWNVEFSNGEIAFYNYPSDIIKDKDILNAYLKFIYYLDGDEWKLLSPSKYRSDSKIEIDGVFEYVSFTFEFSFNGYKNIKNDTLAAYSIFYYKK